MEPIRHCLSASRCRLGRKEIGQLTVKVPGTWGGRARVAGRRIPVSSIYRWFLNGRDPEDILAEIRRGDAGGGLRGHDLRAGKQR